MLLKWLSSIKEYLILANGQSNPSGFIIQWTIHFIQFTYFQQTCLILLNRILIEMRKFAISEETAVVNAFPRGSWVRAIQSTD